MTTITEAKTWAKRLRATLADQGTDISHSAALELVARQLGHADWNVAAATLPDGDAPAALSFERAIPVLRSFDEAKAREFYCGFLGFTIQFEHRFEPHTPLYMEVARAGLALHLSEHHGDASPGSTVFVWMHGIADFQRELIDRHYGYGRPGLNPAPWGTEMVVHDPFGNRLRFCEKA